MMRVALFLLTNLAVMFVFGIILTLFGVQSSSVYGLMIMAGLFGFGGAFISLLTSKWMALRSVNGEKIIHPNNETEQWLVQTIQRLAQQANIGMPDVAIYHAEDMNAFATGANKNASLVAVSTGLLRNMSRSEVEAVLAHEISHIANGDMVTMTLLQGILNTFVIFISRLLAQVASGYLSNNREGSTGIYFLTSMILEMVFGILASIIAMWFSRYREYRADAGSASLVGAEKMIAALQRLKTSYEPEESTTVMAFCINGNPRKFGELLMSHPPLDKRIEALRNNSQFYS